MERLLEVALALGVLTVGLGLIVAVLPWSVRPLLRLLLAFGYRFHLVGTEHIPPTGPVMLASNHVTWIDGFILAALCPRRGKALVNADYLTQPVLGFIARRAGIIAVPVAGPKAQRAAIEAVRRALDAGQAVLIFPEAQLTRNGLLGPFYRGLELMMKGHEAVPIVPVYLDNLWGSRWSCAPVELKARARNSRRGRRRVVIAFGRAVAPPPTAFRARQGVQEASVAAFRALAGDEAASTPRPEVDASLPSWTHPELGPLTGSTPDYDNAAIHQTGQKPGTVGQALPGVALRVVDAAGRELDPDHNGRIEALTAARQDWTDTGSIGAIDREGFVRLEEAARS